MRPPPPAELRVLRAMEDDWRSTEQILAQDVEILSGVGVLLRRLENRGLVESRGWGRDRQWRATKAGRKTREVLDMMEDIRP